MYKKVKKALLILFSAVFVTCGIVLSACSSSCNKDNSADYDGLFSGSSHKYVLSSDYKLTEADVKATKGEDNVTLDYICSFNLNGHSLDLNGYTLKIVSDSTEAVKFDNGSIKNGSLDISVPNGDIEFTGATLESSVVCAFEAASETIKISNSVISGKSTVKSNTHVSVEYSNVGNITLSGNGTLTAGSGAEMGAVTVSENASGATVNVSPDASVMNMELQAAANVKVAGNVSSVKVAEAVKNDSKDLSIEIQASATVTKVELNASAKVDVKGSVQAVTVSETAKNDSSALSINVAEGAEVARVELKAPADVAVSGGVSNIVVADTAGGSSVTLNETASVATVAVKAENITIDSNENANVSKVVVAESVKDTVESNIEFVTATDEEMEDYFAHQHIFVIVSKENATCTEKGKIVYECECGETKQSTVPALGHDYKYEVIKEPTADADGEGRYTCKRCGYSYTDKIIKSVSFVVDSLHEIYSLIPDGTYNLSADKSAPVTISQEDGGTITVTDLDTVITVEGSKVCGTVKLVVNFEFANGERQTSLLRAVIDDNIVHVYTSSSIVNGELKEQYSNSLMVAISAGLKMAFAEFLPFDIDNLDGVLELLKGINFGEGEGIVSALLEKVIDGAFTVNTVNGDKVYSLDADKLVKSLEALGAETPAELIDAILGDGTFGAIKTLLDGVADKTVLSVVSELYKIAETYGISQEQLFSLAQTVVDNIFPEEMRFDVKETVVGYYDKTVAYTLAALSGEMTEAQAKATIEEYTGMIIETCTNSSVSELVDMMLDRGSEQGEGMSYASILEMVGAYAENATVTVTLGSQNNLKAFEISYVNTENGINVSIVKTADSNIPVVVVDVMGVNVNLDEKDGAAELTVEVQGMVFTLCADKTESGANLDFTATVEGENVANVNLDIIAKKDAQNNLIGAELVFGGEIDANVSLGGGESVDRPSSSEGPGFADDVVSEAPAPEKKAPVVIDGKLNLTMNGGANLDKDVWDSFDGDKELFYHMDLTAYNNHSGLINLKWMSDGSGEYYLLTKTKYETSGLFIYEKISTVRLLSVNGLPEIFIMSEPDCQDWVIINFTYYAIAEVTETKVAGGRIEYSDGIPALVGGVRDESRTYDMPVDFTRSVWLNTETGATKNSSAHEYEYSGVYADGSEKCYDGILVTKRCTVCNETTVEKRLGHYYTEEIFALYTQCGNSSDITKRECIVCGEYSVHQNYYEHRMSESTKLIVTQEEFDKLSGEDKDDIGRYVSIDDVAALGFKTEGFYIGRLYTKHCAECGLNIYHYIYNTHTDSEGCLKHEVYVAEYNGNKDYKAFRYSFETADTGHHSSYGNNGEYANVTTAVNEVKALGIDLPFTPETANYYISECDACGITTDKTINLKNESMQANLDIWIFYENGSVNGWRCEGYIYDDGYALAQAKKYHEVSNPKLVCGYVKYENSSYEYEYKGIRLYAENEDHGDTLFIGVRLWKNGNSTKEINEYDYDNCTVYISNYLISSKGVWVLQKSYSEARHDYVGDYIYSENCNEDGFYYFNGCTVCGYSQSGGHYEVEYGHRNVVPSGYETEIQNVADRLLKNDNLYVLDGLNATVYYEALCYNCKTLINANIVLRNDWTLTSDVYLKAEGLTLDLNGFTIDLNGYNLVLYSYDGRTLVVTDNSFDTSLVEDFDPENPVYTSKITNSSNESGIFIVASYAYNPEDESVIIGTIAIEANNFLTDSDNRYTLMNSVYEEYGEWLSVLEAQRPPFADYV